MSSLKLLSAGVVLVVMVAGCPIGSAGGSSNVPLSDFFGLKPSVEIVWPRMTLTIPTNYPSSLAYISPRVKVEGDSILIKAKYVLRQKPATTTFNLSKLGMKKEKISSAKAFWVNPDGTKKQLEIELKPPSRN